MFIITASHKNARGNTSCIRLLLPIT